MDWKSGEHGSHSGKMTLTKRIPTRASSAAGTIGVEIC